MPERVGGPAVGHIREHWETILFNGRASGVPVSGLVERRKKNIMICDSVCIPLNVDYHIAPQPPLRLQLGLEKRVLSLDDTSWALLR